jgi:hypothetical protein
VPKIDLTDEEHAAVTTLLNRTVSESRFPFSDRIRNPVLPARERLG